MNDTLQQRIKKVRINNDLLLTELASRLGVRRIYLSKIERGIVNPDLKFLNDMCWIFNLSEKWLLFGEGDMLTTATPSIELLICSDTDCKVRNICEHATPHSGNKECKYTCDAEWPCALCRPVKEVLND